MRISMTVVMDVPEESGRKVRNRVTAAALKAAIRAGGSLRNVGSREVDERGRTLPDAAEKHAAPRFFTVGPDAAEGGPA